MADVARLLQNFENVLEPKECIKTGNVPSYLKGTMLRNGPGMFTIGDSKSNHLFDGLAYIQRYHFKDGKMWYSARYLESDDYKADMAAQRIVHTQFGTYKYSDPCKSIFHRFFSYFFENESVTDNDNVAFSIVGDGIYALTETPLMTRVDPDTLERLGKVDVSKYLTLNTYTAHHHSDYEGNTYNIGTQFGKDSNYVFAKTLNPLNHKSESSHSVEHTSLIGNLPCSDPMAPGYYHSFGMSENYLILLESPVRISVKKLLMRKLMMYSYHDALYWDENKEVNVLIMDKKSGKPLDVKVTSDPFFTFHHANGFEKDGCLVVDYCKMENPGDFSELSLDSLRGGFFNKTPPGLIPYLHRMVIPLTVPSGANVGDNLLEGLEFAKGCSAVLKGDGSIHVADIRVCEESFEFPRYNYENYNMKDYKYVYGTSLLADSGNLVGVVKANVQEGTHIVWKRKDQTQLCAEPIFVPNPEGVDEDDGLLLVPVMTTTDGDRPYVVVVDAKDLKEMARYEIQEARIPLSFHAMYAARADL